MELNLFTPNQPILSLLKIFIAWKGLLFLIAISSPGPGYDTSTSLLLSTQNGTQVSYVPSLVAEKLTRWDAIYFTRVAERGYLFEQEWAFGWGWTSLISVLTAGLRQTGIGHHGDLRVESLVGIFIAHFSHALSVLVLYHLTNSIFTSSSLEGKKFAFLSACLHIFSPAGLFLSAPYAESTFALLSFSGYYLFIRSSGPATSNFRNDISLISAGLLFGISTTIRSNGLLNGILFLEEAVRAFLSLRIRRLLIAGIGGALIGLSFLLPQFIAYRHFCLTGEVDGGREWCTRMVPSIYAFVQSHYWNSGLFRYWTLSNIPLFLLATPMLSILAVSSFSVLKTSGFNSMVKSESVNVRVVRTMAIVQAVLGLMTFVNAHVQIITRLASGYPVWYWYTATKITETNSEPGLDQKKDSKRIVRWMVMYAIIQGGLFSSFLPPA